MTSDADVDRLIRKFVATRLTRGESEVAQVVAKHQRLVVAEQEVHGAAGLARLLFQRIQVPEGFGDPRAAVEHVAGHHQVAVAPAPAALGIDHAVGAQ